MKCLPSLLVLAAISMSGGFAEGQGPGSETWVDVICTKPSNSSIFLISTEGCNILRRGKHCVTKLRDEGHIQDVCIPVQDVYTSVQDVYTCRVSQEYAPRTCCVSYTLGSHVPTYNSCSIAVTTVAAGSTTTTPQGGTTTTTPQEGTITTTPQEGTITNGDIVPTTTPTANSTVAISTIESLRAPIIGTFGAVVGVVIVIVVTIIIVAAIIKLCPKKNDSVVPAEQDLENPQPPTGQGGADPHNAGSGEGNVERDSPGKVRSKGSRHVSHSTEQPSGGGGSQVTQVTANGRQNGLQQAAEGLRHRPLGHIPVPQPQQEATNLDQGPEGYSTRTANPTHIHTEDTGQTQEQHCFVTHFEPPLSMGEVTLERKTDKKREPSVPEVLNEAPPDIVPAEPKFTSLLRRLNSKQDLLTKHMDNLGNLNASSSDLSRLSDSSVDLQEYMSKLSEEGTHCSRL